MPALPPARLAPLLGAVFLALSASAGYGVSSHSSAIDVTPAGDEVWVVNPDHGSVGVIKTQGTGANTLQAEIPVGREPWCLDVHPFNGEVWVASLRDDCVYVIDQTTRAVIDTISTGFDTFGIAFNPAGTIAYATASGADEVCEIDVASRTVTNVMDVYRRPRAIAWSHDGTKAWVSHLLHFEYFGRLTEIDAATFTSTDINIQQVFGTDRGGYMASMQNITLAPAPGDSILWIPTHLINSAKGELSGIPLTPTNMFHSVVRPVNVATRTDMNWDTYFLSEGGTPASGYAGGTTPVGAPIAVDFRPDRAFVANFWSNDVTVLWRDLLAPQEYAVLPVGNAPIGIVTHADIHRGYVANWLSRTVTVLNTSIPDVIATVPSTFGDDPLTPQLLNGKQLFFTSTGRMSLENRNSCSGCHVLGWNDGRNWDLTQSGIHVRATPLWRGAGFTGPFGWTAGFDEIQDNEWSVRGLLGGVGLIDGMPNPSLGAPNQGLSQDLDDLSRFMALQALRPDTPYLNPDGSQTAEADSGEVLFHDPVVGCAVCHPAPFYTDSSPLNDPYLLHDVGTADSLDANGANGYDTPSLVAAWNSGPYLHNHLAKTMEAVLTTFNPNDEHGVTSHLSPEQIGFLAEFVLSIGWPDSTGYPLDAPQVAAQSERRLDPAFPNPFGDRTSLRFRVPETTSPVRIDVYDVNGRHVRTLIDRPMTRGGHVVGWDSRDASGRAVGAGVYFARLVVNGREAGSKKLTVLR